MIWGETKEQRYARLNAIEPQPWFAWFPVILKDGRYAWLSTIVRRRVAGFDWWFYEARILSDQAEGGSDG